MIVDVAAQRAWMAQWRGAAVALAAQRERELRGLSDAQALAASEALLALGSELPLHAGRRTRSGLVEQQALLHRRAGR